MNNKLQKMNVQDMDRVMEGLKIDDKYNHQNKCQSKRPYW